jgi:hypothetical protein
MPEKFVKERETESSEEIEKYRGKSVRDAEVLHPSGITIDFTSSITISINAGSPNNQPDFTSQLTGTTQLLFGKPKDAIVGDPLVGNVGQVDGKFDVSPTELVSTTAVGATPFAPQITVRVGDGVADLAPTPSGKTLPYDSLYSGGAVSKKPGHSGTLDTFFNVFLEIQNTPEGSIRNKTPIALKGEISPASLSNGHLTLNYSSSGVTALYTAGADGVFWTGDEVEFARLVPGANGNSLTVNFTSSSSW